MIGYLQGEILEHSEGKMLVGVGDRKSGGVVGYAVSVPQSAEYGAFASGHRIELFVHAHVREDAFDLYGFSSKSEKLLFLTLLNVNGIGPKSALGILSSVESGHLVHAIIQGDQAFLTQIPGIGKKTAERVVVELRDSMKKKVESGAFIMKNQLANDNKGRDFDGASSKIIKEGIDSAIYQDAKAALLNLGYREQDVQQLLNRVLEDSKSLPRKAEDLIRTALRQLA